MPKKRLYAVKSLFRVEVVGEPTGADDDYDPDGMLIEERVVLLMARSLCRPHTTVRQDKSGVKRSGNAARGTSAPAPVLTAPHPLGQFAHAGALT